MSLITVVSLLGVFGVAGLWGWWAYAEALLTAGGMLLMWDRRVVKEDVFLGSFSVYCCFQNAFDGFVWVMIAVSCPSEGSERKLLWEELRGVKCKRDAPWCIGGDFIAVGFPSERSSNGRFTAAMLDSPMLLANRS